MSRKNITGEEGEFLGWFDSSCCKAVFEEDTYFNGHNQISKATGSQWIHETLYLTAKETWVIGRSGNYKDTYFKISRTQAARWLMQNDHDDNKNIPADIAEIMNSHEM